MNQSDTTIERIKGAAPDWRQTHGYHSSWRMRMRLSSSVDLSPPPLISAPTAGRLLKMGYFGTKCSVFTWGSSMPINLMRTWSACHLSLRKQLMIASYSGCLLYYCIKLKLGGIVLSRLRRVTRWETQILENFKRKTSLKDSYRYYIRGYRSVYVLSFSLIEYIVCRKTKKKILWRMSLHCLLWYIKHFSSH